MRLAIERRRSSVADGVPWLLEVVTPRTNTAGVTPAENLLAGSSGLDASFSLELAATDRARRFLVRAPGALVGQHLAEQLGAAYPQAGLRPVREGPEPGSDDPAHLRSGERVAACVFALRGPAYLPIRTFRDADLEGTHAPQADPVLGLLAALGSLPAGWRALSQLVLEPAPDAWCEPYLRYAIEHPLAGERTGTGHGAATSLLPAYLLGGALLAGPLALQGWQWVEAGAWLPLRLLGAGLAAGLLGFVWLLRCLLRRPLYDVRLVQEKVSRLAYRTELRLAVFAPAEVDPSAIERRLRQVAGAYRQYSLAAGNGLVPRALRHLAPERLASPCPLGSPSRLPVLNTRELAGLWHLAQAQADLPVVERTTARRWLAPATLEGPGCRVGTSEHQGRSVAVTLPDALLRRHLFLVAKTRRGKSSLLVQVARHLMRTEAGRRPAVVLVDPHRDLAHATLALVPPERRGDVVYLDFGEERRPFGLNLLDVGLGWSRDRAVSSALVVFRRQFDQFWGPRMEDAFRFALLTLYEANRALCAADPTGGRNRQHTVLEVPYLLVSPSYRQVVLRAVADPLIKAWWAEYFQVLDPRLRLEVMNPVQTKVNRLAGSRAALVLGQPRSTVNPFEWVRDGKIVLVNVAARGADDEDTSALIGGALVNLVALAIADQARLDPEHRRATTVLVDEFHALPTVDYEAILSELGKYGGNLVFATQSLATLDALDRRQGRPLRPTVFANLDGLFAFQCSADDARYLARELGRGIEEQDLLELGDYQCYARLSLGGERVPPFFVRLDPPPLGNRFAAEQLALASAAIYGRGRRAVEADIRSTLARIEQARQTAVLTTTSSGQGNTGVARDAATTPGTAARNQNRPGRKANRPGSATAQASLFDRPGDSGTVDALAPSAGDEHGSSPNGTEAGEAREDVA